MSSPSFFLEPRVPRLAALLREVKEGQILVPRFQRPFVWTDTKRLELLESVFRGYPIGSLLVWRTQEHSLKTRPLLGRLPVPTGERGVGVRQYLLDGHQRVTTLFNALGPGLYPEDDRAGFGVQEDVQWPIYFDLAVDPESTNPFRLAHGKTPPLEWIPVDILLDSFLLSEHKDRLRAAQHGRESLNRVQALADIFRDYTMPVVPIVTEDLARVTTSFKRVNSAGEPMSDVHMVHALGWEPDFDLLELLEGVTDALQGVGWGSLEAQYVLNLCKAFLGLDLLRAAPEQVVGRLKAQPEVIERARDGLVGAAGLLREAAGVHGPEALPYTYQAVALAALVDKHSREMPMERVGRWFWATTLTEHFAGMTTAAFQRIVRDLELYLFGEKQEAPIRGSAPVTVVDRFDYRSARTRGLALLMGRMQERVLNDASGLKLLAKTGNEALPRLISATGWRRDLRLDGPANRVLADGDQLQGLRRELGSAEPDQRLLEAHGISLRDAEHWRNGDLDLFLLGRAGALRALELEAGDQVGLYVGDGR